MTEGKILAITIPLSVAAVLITFLFTVSRCTYRDNVRKNEQALECIKNGGTYLEIKGNSNCVINGKVKTNE